MPYKTYLIALIAICITAVALLRDFAEVKLRYSGGVELSVVAKDLDK